MGNARKVEDDDNINSSSSSSPLLIAATMCIIGLQVHVHVKDGSVFSGIFFTASVDNGFGIVLKNARITKKGTSKSNVASGSVVDTLVILSSNIVQIIAEGVSLPSNVRAGNNEVGSATETLPSEPRLCAANKSTYVSTQGRGYNHKRQAGAQILKRRVQILDVHQEDNIDIQSSSSSLDSMSERVKPIEEHNLMPEPLINGFHDAAERPSSTDNSLSESTTVDDTTELCQGRVASSTASVPIQAVKKAKEFKLNPEAKIFSPSYTKRLSRSPVGMPDGGNIAYIPSNTPMLPVPEAIYPGIGNNPYVPQAPPPSKFVPYGNLTAGHAVSGFQFPQHMIGPTVNRAQPQRFTTQYHSVQAAPVLVNPSPQVMVARSGQLVYVQSVSQDLVQGSPPISPMLSRPLPTAQHVQYLKHHGVVAAGQPLQLCVSQPFTTGGLQPYGVPAQFPVMQPPFPTNQPMTIAVPNGFYTKFP
ncbi:LSM domain superfamily [Arabidopsis suecica]|uniref:LSM domain superfamily n=1 Tax=Arabidopsis suecica TaxID=45249 RepID=A0A8T1YJ32_ARASU|nr:LSM domain superfamily [Arabidopsis suecica]